MKKLISYAFVLILNSVLVCQPALILAASEASKPPLPPRSTKVTAASKTRKTTTRAKTQAQGLAGQTSTLLSDGRLLIIGGLDNEGPKTTVAISDPRSGETTPLSVSLYEGRAWHTATMLPDGRVLVIGGKGQDNKIVQSAEIVDPGTQTCDVVPSAPLAFGRAYHTATLLTDGRVLIVGGESARGNALNRVELWDFKTRTAKTLPSKLGVGRQKQKATLQADGTVLIEGGFDAAGNEIASNEIFNNESLVFALAGSSSSSADQNTPYLAGSVPENNAIDVPLDTLIGLRFSRPLDVQTLNPGTITLNGPNGGVAAKIVPAENGRLAFITPLPSLAPSTTYTISLSSAADGANTVSPGMITFTTAGKTEDPRTHDEEDWIPGEYNFHGNWRSKVNNSPLQSLPPLQAAPGVTAVAGQTLTLNGRALANVTIKVGARSVRSDDTGRFLLEEVATGHQVMVIDGRTASTSSKTYGVFKVGVDIIEGKTNALGYTVWMPKLDTRNSVTISSPTATNVTVSSPRIPGLELRLPPQTVLRDMDGQNVHQLSITPIPTNQPPFPLPSGVNVPVYFTIQPGGSQIIPPRAQLVYPNFMNAAPGTRIDFYNYDATEKGWYVYGKGTVTADSRRIVPDAGVVLYELSGAMVSNPSNAPPEGPPPCAACEDGDPVDLSTGLFVYETTDLIVRDTIPISLKRTYRPRDTVSRPFGIGATHPYEIFLVGDIFPYTYQDLILANGGRVHYNRISPGTGFSDAVYEHTGSPSIFYKSTIRWIGGWELKLRDGTVYTFPDSEGATVPRAAAALTMRDRFGNSLVLSRDSNRNLTQITTPNGRYVRFTYDTSNRITQASDNIGRTVSYTYDGSGRLWKVTDVTGGVTQFGYDTSNRMTTIKDPKLITYITNQYDTNGRVTRQTMADNSVYQFAYTLDANNRVTQTNVTNPRGIVRRVTFNSSGYMLIDTYALGKPEQQSITYERQAGTNLLLSITDAIGRRVAYTYDSMGNQTSVTRLAGTPEAVTTSFTYEPNFNELASITDPLNHTISFTYDTSGRLIGVTDPLNHQATFAYNAAGQMTSLVDPLQNTLVFGYQGGDLVNITDPLGHTATRFIDDAGRVLALTNPLGQVTRFNYDAASRPTRITDPLGNQVSFAYDANGYLTAVTDPRNNVTTYTYNNMDRLASRKDALLKVESYQYDAAGNITKYTDRRGKVTTFTYDNLDRQTFVGYGTVVQGQSTTYESTVTNTYDAANRLTRVVDSVAGTVNLGYDNLDRLTSESTPQGTVTYSYDNAGRRTSMTVAGQPSVSYTYDNANRLTGIAQGEAGVIFSFDNANRPTSVTLPNGIVVDYGYDANSQLTSINYRNGAALLGNLSYEYDGIGHRTKVGGSFARLGLPQTVSSATHNATNQLTQKNGTSLTYDANGNLTSDGVNSYAWNARNQLISMGGPGLTASFQYDAFGRRIKKTVNGIGTDYLYDGANAVQELSSGTPTANMLTGGLDNVFTRTDSDGPRTLLTDGLNSTLALADSSGALQSHYTYEPFGKATVSGTANNNTSQYTGRENDGTGLYYYRARYYSPSLQRFISEDPIGFLGGDVNLYAYTANSPTNYIDPSGQWIDTLLDIGFIGYDLYSLATGSRKDLGTNLAALGLDIAGALIPVATGLGGAFRAERAAASGTEVVQRAMSRAELEATQRTGLLRGGREGTHYVSDAVNSDAKRARQRLSLPQTPEVRVTMEVPKGSCSAPTRVNPANNMPGGGMERTATGKVPVKVTKVDPY